MTYPISRFLNVRVAYAPIFAADGRSLLFLSDVTGNAEVWRIRIEQSMAQPACPQQLTFNGDRVMFIRCSPVTGNEWLLYGCDQGGNERAQLFLLNAITGQEIALTNGYENAMHAVGDWSPDGRFFFFAANRERPAYFDLYRQPIAGGEAQLIWQNDKFGYVRGQKLSPDGRFVVIMRHFSSFHHDMLLVNIETGEAKPLSPSGQKARFTHVAYDKSGRFLYVNTDLDSDFLHTARLDLASLTWEKIVYPNWDVEIMSLSPNGRYLAYVINQDGVSQLELIDLGMGQVRIAPLPVQAPGVVGFYSNKINFSQDSRYLTFAYSNAIQTHNILVWDTDLNHNAVHQMTQSNHGGIPESKFAIPQLIHYPTFDERQIPAWFFSPNTTPSAKRPVVIIVHGGPESQSRPYFNFLIQYLIQQEYAVLVPNVRGSTGYGKAYSHLDDIENRMDSVADLAYAAYWLQQQPQIDHKRIVVYGGSYGGFMVMAALTHYPSLWAAGVNIVGISNIVTFLENTSDYRRAHREAEYGSLQRDRGFLEEIAPMNHVQKIEAPLMVVHGANDPRVPLSEAEQLVAALQARDVPVEFLVFHDEGHGVAKLKNKRIMYPAVVQFLQTYNLG